MQTVNHRNKTQTEMIREHLESGKEITALDALLKFGINRLAARIHELRADQGLQINSRIEKKDGKIWAVYSLEKGE